MKRYLILVSLLGGSAFGSDLELKYKCNVQHGGTSLDLLQFYQNKGEDEFTVHLAGYRPLKGQGILSFTLEMNGRILLAENDNNTEVKLIVDRTGWVYFDAMLTLTHNGDVQTSSRIFCIDAVR